MTAKQNKYNFNKAFNDRAFFPFFSFTTTFLTTQTTRPGPFRRKRMATEALYTFFLPSTTQNGPLPSRWARNHSNPQTKVIIFAHRGPKTHGRFSGSICSGGFEITSFRAVYEVYAENEILFGALFSCGCSKNEWEILGNFGYVFFRY